MIELCGLKLGRDIQIVYSGVRPGEKLDEELFLAGEEFRPSGHPKIFATAREDPLPAEVLEQLVLAVSGLAGRVNGAAAAEQIRALLPEMCRYIDQGQRRIANNE
jgi:FlaA1/EpsC-like NDP-sugar epimerase